MEKTKKKKTKDDDAVDAQADIPTTRSKQRMKEEGGFQTLI